MSDHQSGSPVFEPASDGPAPAVESPRERVMLGLLAASLAAVLGAVLSVVLWRGGFIASLSSFLIAGGAVFLYVKAAGAAPRKGLAPLVLLILVGVVLSFFAVVASDVWDAYDRLGVSQYDESRATFLSDNLTNPDVLRQYGSDIAMFAIFAALGTFGTMRRLLARR